MLRVIASFENEKKRNVITRNFQLNETGETTTQREFYTFKSLFSSRIFSGISLRVIEAERIMLLHVKKLFITWNYVLRVIAIFGNET